MADVRVRSTDPPEEAIPRLLEAHGGRILALGHQLCPTAEDASDLVQETFIRAFRGWPRFEGRSAPSTWLYTIAVRACQRMRRRQKSERQRIEKAARRAGPISAAEGEGALPRHGGPLEDLVREETLQTVRRAIADLPWHFRLPLVLKELAGFSIAEVARVLDLKEATVKTRVHRARLALRDALQQGTAPKPGSEAHAEKRICLDLLAAKQEALDRGAPYPLPPQELCDRCRAVFEALDLAHETCLELSRDRLPDALRETLLSDIEDLSKR